MQMSYFSWKSRNWLKWIDYFSLELREKHNLSNKPTNILNNVTEAVIKLVYLGSNADFQIL